MTLSDSSFFVSENGYRFHGRTPALEFGHPIVKCRFGNDDQMRAAYAVVVLQIAEERNRLQRFSETL